MKKPRIQQDDAPGGLTHNPFAALRPGGAPANKAPAKPARSAKARAGEQVERKEPVAAPRPAPGKMLVQREKKGRSGKTVTRVVGCRLLGLEADEVAQSMKRALGCGASVEGKDILLQGAMTERAAAWLRKQHDVDVTIGN